MGGGGGTSGRRGAALGASTCWHASYFYGYSSIAPPGHRWGPLQPAAACTGTTATAGRGTHRDAAPLLCRSPAPLLELINLEPRLGGCRAAQQREARSLGGWPAGHAARSHYCSNTPHPQSHPRELLSRRVLHPSHLTQLRVLILRYLLPLQLLLEPAGRQREGGAGEPQGARKHALRRPCMWPFGVGCLDTGRRRGTLLPPLTRRPVLEPRWQPAAPPRPRPAADAARAAAPLPAGRCRRARAPLPPPPGDGCDGCDALHAPRCCSGRRARLLPSRRLLGLVSQRVSSACCVLATASLASLCLLCDDAWIGARIRAPIATPCCVLSSSWWHKCKEGLQVAFGAVLLLSNSLLGVQASHLLETDWGLVATASPRAGWALAEAPRCTARSHSHLD